MIEYLTQFINFLLHHQHIVYLILFLGSMFETIIGFSFFIYGEIFFLAGSIMAGMGILSITKVTVVLFAGASLGDNISYWIGRKYGKKVFNLLGKIKFIGKYFAEQKYQKMSNFLRQKGAISIFLARLLGPLSWIMPFIAGVSKVDYRKFLLYNSLGIIVGIGQFILVGYIFGLHYEKILKNISWSITALLILIVFFLTLKFYLKKIKEG